ncbi:hypothetical protein EXS65_04065 [Candidatus Peribacteria bacterium]|nr:hypothetical protein [Candidatus Peribacteria bacterium]
MGFFWNWNKDNVGPQKKATPMQPTSLPGDPKPQSQPQPEKNPEPKQKEAPAVDHGKSQDEIEMRKFVFRLSSHDPEKCSVFIKEILRKVNRHDWHTLSGRIGKHSDGIKMRMDIKGKHDDIQNFIQWCKLTHFGVHAYEVMEQKAYSMPYSGFPLFQEQKSHWSTA